MTEQEAIARAGEKYRGEGYAVTENPDPAGLPVELRGRHPALLAAKNGTSVLVEVWSRDRVDDPPPQLLPAGWEFDVVVVPRAPAEDLAPGPPPTQDFAARLLGELDELLPRGAVRARFLLAWSAAEAAMRVAARREGIAADALLPRLLATELVTAGVISQEEWDRFRTVQPVRNRLTHGLPADPGAGDIDFLTGLARSLLATPVAAAG
jgi:hypothetical protein